MVIKDQSKNIESTLDVIRFNDTDRFKATSKDGLEMFQQIIDDDEAHDNEEYVFLMIHCRTFRNPESVKDAKFDGAPYTHLVAALGSDPEELDYNLNRLLNKGLIVRTVKE